MKKQFYLIMVVVLIVLSAVAYFLQPQFSFPVLMTGNAILFALSVITFSIVSKSFGERPQAFVRGVSSGSLIKLFVCAGGVLIYAMATRPHVDKMQIFALMGMYAVYSIVENILLSRMAKANQ